MTKELADFKSSYHQELDKLSLPDKYREDYTILSCLKHTANKSIFLLQNNSQTERNGRRFILKIARNQFMDQLAEEAHLLQTITKQQDKAVPFPKFLDFQKTEPENFLLREYISGLSLSEYLDKRLVLSKEEILDFMLEICDIITIFHTNKTPIIHRDIKAENFIKSREDGKLYLIDFDTIRKYDPADKHDTQFLGTPAGAAPEQFGFTQSDIRTDIYAIGKTMLYLCTGSYDDAMLNKSSIYPPFRRIIKRCISFDPKKRYASVKKIKSRLCLQKMKFRFPDLQKTATYLLCILSVGLICFNLLYMIPSGRQQSQDTEEVSSTEDTSSIENQPNDTSTDTSQESSEAQNDTPENTDTRSLLDQADYIEPDFTPYKKYVDKIILSFYKQDKASVIKYFKTMMEKLSKDSTLKNYTGHDYAGLSKLPEEAEIQSYKQTIVDFMAYRDRIIVTNIPNYDKDKEYIYNALSGFIGIKITDLYSYASSPQNNPEDTAYVGALSDLLRVITIAYDQIDNITVRPY